MWGQILSLCLDEYHKNSNQNVMYTDEVVIEVMNVELKTRNMLQNFHKNHS